MKLKNNNDVLEVVLSCEDIECLKRGDAVAERFDGEHKFNLSVTGESFIVEDWTTTDGMPHRARFDAYLHDFFMELPMFDIRNSFIRSNTVLLPQNPLYTKVKIIYP